MPDTIDDVVIPLEDMYKVGSLAVHLVSLDSICCDGCWIVVHYC